MGAIMLCPFLAIFYLTLLLPSATAQASDTSAGVIPTPAAIPHGNGPVVETSGTTIFGRLGTLPIAGTASSTSAVATMMMSSTAPAEGAAGGGTKLGTGLSTPSSVLDTDTASGGSSMGTESGMTTTMGSAGLTSIAAGQMGPAPQSTSAMMSASSAGSSGSGANALLIRGDWQEVRGIAVGVVAAAVIGCAMVGRFGWL